MKQLLNPIKVNLATDKECTGCMVCIDVCPAGAISSIKKKDGHEYVNINMDLCIHCHRCENVCRSLRKEYGINDCNKSKIYGGWANTLDYRKRGTSGGIFAAIAASVIENGGCVVGAYFDGVYCQHIIIDKMEDIKLLQGSKYVHSSTEGIYKIIELEVKKRDVLFSGVGCQCAAVIEYFAGKKLQHELYVVDLVCGGMPSRILIDKYFKANPNIKSISSFRNKDKYELRVKNIEDTETSVKERNLPLHGFNCGMTSRYCCYDCKFAYSHRKSDITLGDLWDYSVLPKEHKNGISMVLVHTERGNELIRNCNVELFPVSWRSALISNKRTVCGKARIYYPRRKIETLAEALSYETFRKLYCISMKPTDIFLEIFRIYRFVMNKYDSFKAREYIDSITKDLN